MSRKKRRGEDNRVENGRSRPEEPVKSEAMPQQSGKVPAEGISVGQWTRRRAAVRRSFPGPRAEDVPLRVAFERQPFADVVSHAKAHLHAEICGVLVGTPCQDEEGDFVHVEAVIAGTHADQGGAHVTFTQDTWNSIHQTMERRYSKKQIVGWYHTHPGFGVEFSEMDVFIQKNFFSAPTQVGLLTDPLSGEVALCINAEEGIRYLPRFWVDAREHRCVVPSPEVSHSAASPGTGGVSQERIASLETRITQLIQAVDETRHSFYRWVFSLGMLLGLAVMLFIARQAVSLIFGEIPEPPQGVSFVRMPVNVDGKACLLGVRVVTWQIPPELLILPKTEEKEAPEGRSPGDAGGPAEQEEAGPRATPGRKENAHPTRGSQP